MDDHGSYVKCPKCGYKQVTYAEKDVTCYNPNGRRHHYPRRKNETTDQFGNGIGDPGFMKASELKTTRAKVRG